MQVFRGSAHVPTFKGCQEEEEEDLASLLQTEIHSRLTDDPLRELVFMQRVCVV